MRFKLILKPVRDRQHLLFNYQYPLQAWIYRLLNHADTKYASFLHEKGYAVPDGNKSFKHFTFSSLVIPKMDKPKPGDTFMVLRSEYISLIVSFYIDQAAEGFIVGLFQNQRLSLYNRDYQADFIVERVETLPLDIPEESIPTIRLKTLSPMVIAEKIENMDQYLAPEHEKFGQLLAQNVMDKLLLHKTDAFGCLYNSSPDGGCQYWHGGKEMCQFFYAFTFYQASFFLVVTNALFRCSNTVVINTNTLLFLSVIQPYSKSEALLLINGAEEQVRNNPQCSSSSSIIFFYFHSEIV